MLGGERDSHAGCVLKHDRWQVVPLELTPEKLLWLWKEMNGYKALFSDTTKGDVANFMTLVQLPDSYWLEVLEGGKPVGIIYWTDMCDLISAQVHVIFWDRKLGEKVELCREVARHFFRTFPHHRIEAVLPVTYHPTLKLAKKIGFVQEGIKRQSKVMDGKRVNEVIFGLLDSEIRES